MLRTFQLFLKAACVAFGMSCVLAVVLVWIAKSLLPDGALSPGAPDIPANPSEAKAVGPVASPRNPPPAEGKSSGAAKIVSAFQFAENVEVSKRRAVQRYPELGVKDSAVNREFIRRMRLFHQINPGFFEDATWPEKLADAMAVDLSLDPQKPADAVQPSP